MTKAQFKNLVASNGGVARYSGKEKTFYVTPDSIIDKVKSLTRHKSRWFIKPA